MPVVDLALLTLPVIALAALVLVVVRSVRADGRGHRSPPPSHLPWSSGTPFEPLER
ncbi:hypothetical protein [Cellulomonas sp. KRMCY2]|uniref:hypothetical protein n=1 Tax=Cellulomonas sp. KRMCY2 TaxID=1304865 RepID=UPI0012DDF3C5|nr:hypothetical protein [Cellulomonas sp. KRMCY2]